MRRPLPDHLPIVDARASGAKGAAPSTTSPRSRRRSRAVQERGHGRAAPLISGIKNVKYVPKNGIGITKFNAAGKGGSYPLTAADPR